MAECELTVETSEDDTRSIDVSDNNTTTSIDNADNSTCEEGCDSFPSMDDTGELRVFCDLIDMVQADHYGHYGSKSIEIELTSAKVELNKQNELICQLLKQKANDDKIIDKQKTDVDNLERVLLMKDERLKYLGDRVSYLENNNSMRDKVIELEALVEEQRDQIIRTKADLHQKVLSCINFEKEIDVQNLKTVEMEEVRISQDEKHTLTALSLPAPIALYVLVPSPTHN